MKNETKKTNDPVEIELDDNVPGQVIDPKELPEVEIPEDFDI